MSQEHMIKRNPCPLFSNFLSSAPQQLVDSSSKSWLRMMTGLQTLFGLISPSLEESPALTWMMHATYSRNSLLESLIAVVQWWLLLFSPPKLRLDSLDHMVRKGLTGLGQNSEASIFDALKIFYCKLETQNSYCKLICTKIIQVLCLECVRLIILVSGLRATNILKKMIAQNSKDHSHLSWWQLFVPNPFCRRIEDKLWALQLRAEPCNLRMAPPPGQKHVPLEFAFWLCFPEAGAEDNIFATSQLLMDRCQSWFSSVSITSASSVNHSPHTSVLHGKMNVVQHAENKCCPAGALVPTSIGLLKASIWCQMLQKTKRRALQKQGLVGSQKAWSKMKVYMFSNQQLKKLDNKLLRYMNLRPRCPADWNLFSNSGLWDAVLHFCRSLSVFQESAQFLAGSEVPEVLLQSLFNKVDFPERAVIGLFNLTPYDTWLETVAHLWPKKQPSQVMPVISLSKSLPIVEYCQRSIALRLLEDSSIKQKTYVNQTHNTFPQ